MGFRLVISIVPHNCGELIIEAANNSGATGGSIIMGRGTASNGILQLLGLGDTSKDITYSIVDDSIYEKVFESIKASVSNKKSPFGVLFNLKVDDFIKAGSKENMTNKESTMEKENTYQMINIIVNKGFAEDAMAAARKAGAGGGTIINARGTAKESDSKFFGMNIVPEKEMLMILVPADKKEGIVSAIKELPCFSQAGSGIVFCNEAADFTLLGK